MNTYYYLDDQQQSRGPVPAEHLPALGVTATTLVWCEGMTAWQPAAAVPELQRLFASQPPVRSKKNNSLTVALLAVAALLAGIAVLGAVLLFSHGNSAPEPEMAVADTAQVAPTDTAQVETPANAAQVATSPETEMLATADSSDDASSVPEEPQNVRPQKFLLSGEMVGFPMTISCRFSGSGNSLTGTYHNVTYGTKMSVSGTYSDGHLSLTGYIQGTSYTFDLDEDDSSALGSGKRFSGRCYVSNGTSKSLWLTVQ